MTLAMVAAAPLHGLFRSAGTRSEHELAILLAAVARAFARIELGSASSRPFSHLLWAVDGASPFETAFSTASKHLVSCCCCFFAKRPACLPIAVWHLSSALPKTGGSIGKVSIVMNGRTPSSEVPVGESRVPNSTPSAVSGASR